MGIVLARGQNEISESQQSRIEIESSLAVNGIRLFYSIRQALDWCKATSIHKMLEYP
jgi:hypothetical protein